MITFIDSPSFDTKLKYVCWSRSSLIQIFCSYVFSVSSWILLIDSHWFFVKKNDEILYTDVVFRVRATMYSFHQIAVIRHVFQSYSVFAILHSFSDCFTHPFKIYIQKNECIFYLTDRCRYGRKHRSLRWDNLRWYLFKWPRAKWVRFSARGYIVTCTIQYILTSVFCIWYYTVETDDLKLKKRDICPSLNVITRHQVYIDCAHFSFRTRSKFWQSDHKIGFLQIFMKSPYRSRNDRQTFDIVSVSIQFCR